MYQMNSRIAQEIQNGTTNTIRRDIRVPRPALGSYRRSNVRITMMYGFSGVMIWVAESPTRNAACVKAGSKPIRANIGTNTAAIRVHIAEPEITNRFRHDARMMNARMAAKPVMPAASSISAPLTAEKVPMPDQLNREMNWPRMNARTRKPSMSPIALVIMSTTSLMFFTVPATLP